MSSRSIQNWIFDAGQNYKMKQHGSCNVHLLEVTSRSSSSSTTTTTTTSVRNRSQFSRSIIGPSERPMTD